MNLIRKVLTTLGGILLAALLIAALAPKATRGLTAAMVQVVNTNSNPVPYFDVNNPATEPFDASLCVSHNAVVFGEDFICSAGSGAFVGPTTAPDGRAVARAVIEQASGTCITFQINFIDLSLSRTVGGHPPTYIPNSIETGGNGIGNSVFSPLVKIYLNPGEQVALGATPGNNGDFVCNVGVVGHLVAQ
jgi:hypothetical protein